MRVYGGTLVTDQAGRILARIANRSKKVLLLAARGGKSPLELWDRLSAIGEVWLEARRLSAPSYSLQTLNDVLARLAGALGSDLASLAADSTLRELEDHVRREIQRI